MGRDGRRRSADKHAFVVGRWSAAELYGLIDTLKALRTRLPRALVRAAASPGRERTLEFNKRALDLLNV